MDIAIESADVVLINSAIARARLPSETLNKTCSGHVSSIAWDSHRCRRAEFAPQAEAESDVVVPLQ